jgi:probable F420-dependent oxidoreductase
MERLGLAVTAGLTPNEVVECVCLAEELGYESAWMAEGHGGDQFSVLTACAMATERIRLGTSITSVFVRSAPTIAMAAACVDHFSNGRFVLGVGTSHKVQVEPEHGLEFANAVPRLRDTVDIVRILLRDGVVSYQGRVIKIDEFDLWFQPLRQEIPIYLAAVFPRMLETAGEIAQGVLLTWCTLDHARTAANHVALGAGRGGKDPGDVEVASLISCGVAMDSTSADEARDSFRPVIAAYAARFPRYRRLMAEAGFEQELEAVRRAWREGNHREAQVLVPKGLIEKMGVIGSPEDCREKLQQYREAGIGLPIVSPRVSGPGSKERAMATIRACAPR